MPSRIVKISNVIDRETQVFTEDDHDELYEDMEAELAPIGGLERIKIIRIGEQRLGAEVGSIFAEFTDKKEAGEAIKKLQGRIYDGKKINVCYVDEKLYSNELCI